MRIMGCRASDFDMEAIEWMLNEQTKTYPQMVRLSEGQLRELQKTLKLRQKAKDIVLPSALPVVLETSYGVTKSRYSALALAYQILYGR